MSPDPSASIPTPAAVSCAEPRRRGVLCGLVIGAAWIAGLGDLMLGVSFRLPQLATLTAAVIAVILGSLAAVLPARRGST